MSTCEHPPDKQHRFGLIFWCSYCGAISHCVRGHPEFPERWILPEMQIEPPGEPVTKTAQDSLPSDRFEQWWEKEYRGRVYYSKAAAQEVWDAAIRLGYEDLLREISSRSISQLPGLLRHIAKLCE